MTDPQEVSARLNKFFSDFGGSALPASDVGPALTAVAAELSYQVRRLESRIESLEEEVKSLKGRVLGQDIDAE
jgi:hypothetical protein